MKAARTNGSWSPYSCPVDSRHTATASSTVDSMPSAPSSPESTVGTCANRRQKKPRSWWCRALAKARSRSSSVVSASNSAKKAGPAHGPWAAFLLPGGPPPHGDRLVHRGLDAERAVVAGVDGRHVREQAPEETEVVVVPGLGEGPLAQLLGGQRVQLGE